MQKKKRKWLVGSIIVLILLGTYLTYTNASKNSASPQKENPDNESLPVSIMSSQRKRFEKKITVSGTVVTIQSALVSARLEGTLDSIFVDEGDWVEKDKTPLFQVDAENWKRKVTVAKEDLSVAESGLVESRANLEKIEAGLEKRRIDAERFRSLYKTQVASADQLEQAELALTSARADMKHAAALLTLAQAKFHQAQVRHDMAEKDLSDSLVLAPISGWITMRLLEPGESVKSGTGVLKIEDLSRLEVSAFLPAESFGQVVVGKTLMQVNANNETLNDLVVSYKSPVIQEKLRTFEVKCIIENPPASIVPGCLAQLVVILESHDGIGVPKEAIVQESSGPYLFVAEGNYARKVSISPAFETNGWVEILEEAIPEHSSVVVKGQNFLEEGSRVEIVSGENR